MRASQRYFRLKGTTSVYEYRNGELHVYAMTGNVHAADHIVLALNEQDERRQAKKWRSA